ncbi:DUF4054 domain-containing protein [Novosphingobium colocasiae]|uniref:DUF4054 domain-containing protein n=1 Tax=Novosphingobium colocasiae TaxID=1256513 RepID=UPI0035ADD0AC
MAIAEFNFSAWTTRYPEFGAVSEERAALFFTEAGLYLDNTDASPVADINVRLMLLNMLTAHIAALSGALEADGKPSGSVGRVSSASEGSVSVSFDTGLSPGTAAWFSQTTYGMAFWQATKNLRNARYVAAPARVTEPWMGVAWRR